MSRLVASMFFFSLGRFVSINYSLVVKTLILMFLSIEPDLPRLARLIYKEIQRDGPPSEDLKDLWSLGLSILTYLPMSFFLGKPIVSLQMLWDNAHYWTWPPLILWWALRTFNSRPKEALWSILKQLWNAILYIIGVIDLTSIYREWLVGKFLQELGSPSNYPEYKYEALNAADQIRLVQLRPTFFGIQCKVIQVCLNDAPVYDAVSYTWGDPAKRFNLKLQDGQYLQITSNVRDILCERSSIFRTRNLWIDSICINQGDTPEKNSQVRLMQRIYTRASRTIVCLGDSSDAGVAVDFLYKMYFCLVFLVIEKDDLANRKDLSTPNPKWAAVRQLLYHPYWSRVWVIQEVVVAKVVHIIYGGRYLDWNLFVTIIRALESEQFGSLEQIMDIVDSGGAMPRGRVEQVCIMAKIRDKFQQDHKASLQQMLVECWNFQATVKVDHIFALQGITTAVDEGALEPNYNSTTPEVYMEVGRYALLSKEPFSLFSAAGILRRGNLGEIPSWVPDWTCNFQLRPLDQITACTNFLAGGTGKACISLLPDHRQIKIDTVILDSVRRVATILPLSADIPTFRSDTPWIQPDFKAFTTSRDSARRQEAHQMAEQWTSDPYITGQPRTEALWRTFICDTSTTSRPAEPEIAEAFKAITRITSPEVLAAAEVIKKGSGPELMPAMIAMMNALKVPEDMLSGLHSSDLAERLQAVNECNQLLIQLVSLETSTRIGLLLARGITGRQFAVTEKGLMALVPLGTQEGDQICIFPGGRTPYILRRDSGDSGTYEGVQCYQLVGEAYVHGFMDGEALVLGSKLEFVILR
ncbi:heterokaryon incompatibility protein-domain-containing protein [Tricladium varicosporioides]|nr:heterokaryon incompatibility protein-domain-containing protein [Hymenoscyphus varicosporioides]